ncbi:MAG TPA: hypothetical protein VIN71_05380 [Pseudomonadales bacterium]
MPLLGISLMFRYRFFYQVYFIFVAVALCFFQFYVVKKDISGELYLIKNNTIFFVAESLLVIMLVAIFLYSSFKFSKYFSPVIINDIGIECFVSNGAKRVWPFIFLLGGNRSVSWEEINGYEDFDKFDDEIPLRSLGGIKIYTSVGNIYIWKNIKGYHEVKSILEGKTAPKGHP